MTKHKRKYHVLKYTCPTCGKGFLASVWFSFIRHMYQHSISNDSTFECICCGYKTDVLTRIDLHRDTHGLNSLKIRIPFLYLINRCNSGFRDTNYVNKLNKENIIGFA